MIERREKCVSTIKEEKMNVFMYVRIEVEGLRVGEGEVMGGCHTEDHSRL